MMMASQTSAFAHSGEIPTYYGHSAVKPSLYGWTVAAYIYVGGLAAGLQIVVTAAQLLALPGSSMVSLIGRAIALAGAILGGILLIVDLHTPQRFYNMLRIFRPTSPMSIGTYVLMGFGFWSLLAFVVQCFDFEETALILGCLAAATGWWMTTYTAALQGATATPLWAGSSKLLAMRYAASAMATGAAAACLIALGSAPTARMALAFANLAALALVVDFVAAIGSSVVLRRIGVHDPIEKAPWGPLHVFGVLICGTALPFALVLLGNFFAPGAFLLSASILILLGGFLMRGTIMLAGNESARRPRDYFRFVGPGGPA
jgi:hypothetical protein